MKSRAGGKAGKARQGYAAICRAVLQRDRLQRMPGLCQYRLAKEPDIRKPAAILGKEILADGVFALGRQRKSDPVEPCASNENGQEQTIRPQRVETVEQYET